MSKAIKGAASVAPGLSLKENEAIIERGLASFVEVGQALVRIREGKQYKSTHTTFETYCQERWRMTRQFANNLIAAAKTVETIVSIDPDLPRPATEGVVRELRPLQEEPETQVEAWGETVRRHGRRPTAKQTRKIVRSRIKPHIRSKDQSEQPKARTTKHKPLKGKQAISHDPNVVEWVRGRYTAGWTREQIVASSIDSTDGWPLPGEHLTNGGVSEVRAVIRALERVEANGSTPVVIKNGTKKELREARARKKSGDLNILVDVRIKLLELIQQTEMIDLVPYAEEMGELEEQEFIDIFERLIRFRIWMERTAAFVQARISDTKQWEMIRHLREDNAGFQENEVELRLKEADRMERRLLNKLGA